MQVFPNPTDSKQKLKFELIEVTDSLNIQLVNFNGRRLFEIYEGTGNHGNHEYNYSLESIASGTYFVVIFINNTEIESIKNNKAMRLTPKVFIRLFLISIMPIFIGCKKNKLFEDHLMIYIGGSFKHEDVEIKINNKTVYLSHNSTSMKVYGKMDRITLDYPVGFYMITVIVNDEVKKSAPFIIPLKGQSIYITYENSNSQIKIEYPDSLIIED